MNELINKFLLARDTFMPAMHFRQPGFTYCRCGPLTKNKARIQKFKETGDLQYNKKIKNKARIQKFKETGDLQYFYQNELDKTYI